MKQGCTSLHALLQRLSLRQRIFLLFAGLAAGAALALIISLYYGYARDPGPATLNAVLTGGIIAGALILGLVVALWRLFDENVAKPLDRLAGDLRARTHAHMTSELEDAQARHLGDLAPAATALIRHLGEARNELAETVARETAQQVIENERLATLLADVPVGVIMCTAEHQIALYNGQAINLLGGSQPADVPGLDRRVSNYLDERPIRQAYEQLLQQNRSDTDIEIVCTACHTLRPLWVRIRLLAGTLAASHGKEPGYVLALHEHGHTPPRLLTSARTIVYDFELLNKGRNADMANTALDDLTYVVFDTETTGLLPSSGDEIVQLAAVRIVNGRLMKKEVLNTLVNPAMAIPAASTRIHGISDAMVADAPAIEQVARRFHKFAQGAVLVAHNASFDLAFLRRTEARIGLRFDHPVLDTVLLSAIVFGQSENHGLDALAARLGIDLPGHARHTAIGDAVATADILLKLLPALKARGLQTIGALQTEMQRHSRLLSGKNGVR